MKDVWHYSSTEYLNPSVQPGLEALFVRLVHGVGRGLRICDLGCGNGRLAWTLASLGHEVVGVDNSPSGIEMARKGSRAGSASFVCAEIDEGVAARLSAGERPFDIVVSSDVIEHLYLPTSLLSAAHALLKPNGSLIVGTPYHGYLKNLAIAVAGKWDSHHGVHWDGGHIKFFSVRSLGDMIRSAGFQDPGFRFYGRAPYLWKNMVCTAVKGM